MARKKTTEEFIFNARRVHGGEFDYSLTEYCSSREKVKIKHLRCGNTFYQRPADHLAGARCPHCFGTPKKTSDIFISQAIKTHGFGIYDYSRIQYVDNKTKVEIGCLLCGDTFFQAPKKHIAGQGCKACAIKRSATKRSLSLNDFVFKAKKVHGSDEYDYGLAEYKNNRTNVKIRHLKCGRFFGQTPSNHLKGQKCPHCFGTPKKTLQEFIAKAENAHGVGVYDYSLVDYVNNQNKVQIRHLECDQLFRQSPASHMKGVGCPHCFGSKKKTTAEFIAVAQSVHGVEKYDYSRVKYLNFHSRVEIGCNTCGDWFWQRCDGHALGQACPRCSGRKRRTTEEFTVDAKKVHGADRYDYSRVDYRSTTQKVEIGCNTCKDWFWQSPVHHMQGSGCPNCSTSGFQPDKPAILYYVKFLLPDSTYLYKIGITNRTVQERFSSEPLPYTILDETPYLFGFLARDREQQILRDHQADRYQGDALVSGNTEAFVCDILGLDKAIAA